jgi:predicted MFS family arabinose efflux permease
LAARLFDRFKDDEWRHWPMILGAGIGMGTAIQLYIYTSSLIMPYWQAEFGWTRGQISAVAALAGLGAIAQPLVGRLVDRVGVRSVVLISCLLMALAYAGMAFMSASLVVFFCLTLFLNVSSAGTSGLPQTRVIAAKFVRNRGFALSLMLTVLPFVSALFVPQFQKILDAFGWRAGIWTLAGALIFVSLPVMLLTLREGERAAPAREKPVQAAEGYDAKAGLKVLPYWLIVAAMVLVNIPGGGVLLHLGPLISDHGFEGGEIAALIAIYPLALLAGRLIGGFLLDRINPSLVACVTCILPSIGFGMFLLGGSDMSYATAAVAIALAGAQQGAELDLLSFFLARHMGLKSYGFFYGFAYMINGFAVSFGTFYFGWIYDVMGSYDAVLLTAVLTFPAGSLCFLLLANFSAYAAPAPVPDAGDAMPSQVSARDERSGA